MKKQPLQKRVLRFIREHGIVTEPGPLVAGVSGGPDSVCLLHILHNLSKTLGINLHVAHLNHTLRGAESDADADYAASLAHELNIPVTIESRDVKAYQKKRRLTLEEAAREVRYTFLAEVARSAGAKTVAVGHTADDQVETILMHLIRGSGLTGLRGMPPLGEWPLPNGAGLRIARPLLEVSQSETEAYCSEHRLAPRSDSSNLLPDQLRNRVRSELIPLLREYNPDFEQALQRTARTAAADMDYIKEEAARLWGTVAREHEDGVSIDKEAFSRLHPALKRHLTRSVLKRLLGDLQDIESVHIESLLEGMAKPAGKSLSLPRSLAFHGDYSHGLVTTKGATTCPLPPLEGEYSLNIPGETALPGWKVTADILDKRPPQSKENEFRACLDLAITGRELTVRGRKRGDRFQPLGMESPKKLQDFMVDARIPRAWRDSVPLACSPRHIVWVAGWRIDNRARVTPQTRRVLRLEFERA